MRSASGEGINHFEQLKVEGPNIVSDRVYSFRNSTNFSRGNSTATCTSPAAMAAMVLPSPVKAVAASLARASCRSVILRDTRLNFINCQRVLSPNRLLQLHSLCHSEVMTGLEIKTDPLQRQRICSGQHIAALFPCWRRVQDSNPRGLSP